jgi:hypothetical protein
MNSQKSFWPYIFVLPCLAFYKHVIGEKCKVLKSYYKKVGIVIASLDKKLRNHLLLKEGFFYEFW